MVDLMPAACNVLDFAVLPMLHSDLLLMKKGIKTTG
jgi:hypothetical protein